jgi:hypothetical protein
LSSSEIDLAIVPLPSILSQISVGIRRQRHTRKGEPLKIRPGELMTPWTIEVKFPYDTQFLFGTLMFTAGEDNPRGLVPSHHEPIYREAPYYPTDPLATSASRGARSGLIPYAG